VGEHKRARRTSHYRAVLGREVRSGVTGVLGVAGVYCLYAVSLFALRGARPFDRNDTTLASVLAAYVAAGALGGAAVGLLHPLRQSLPGLVVVTTVCATLAFFAVTVATDGSPTRWGPAEWRAAAVLGLLFGPVAAAVVHRQR
jgi:hypothetical protein